MLIKRKGIHVDINPIANFMAESLAMPVEQGRLKKEFENVVKSANNDTNWYWYPQYARLPQNADKRFVHELFERRQLRELSCFITLYKKNIL